MTRKIALEPAAFPARLNIGTEGANSTKQLTNSSQHPHNQHHHQQQTDPLIESLDESEEVEDWLNGVIRSQQRGTGSALHLEVEGDKGRAVQGWSERDNLGSLESQLSSLSTTLSIARQDTLSVIDSTINSVNGAIPRLGLELRLMKDAALTLKASIDHLRQQATASEAKDTQSPSSTSTASSALQRLSALSNLHSRMSSARDVLSLAESWSTLSADVTSYLSESKYPPACSRLAEAQSSLAVFERTPEYASRKRLLESLCDSLVSSISPSLETAVKEKNVGEAQRIASTLSAIGRGEEFGEKWRKARTGPWLAQWRNARPSEEAVGGEGSGISFVQLLPTLLDSLLTLLNEERLFAPSLFAHNPRKSMQIFTLTTLQALDPPYKTRVRLSIQQHPDQAILALARIHTAVKNAVSEFSRAIGRVDGANSKSPIMAPNGSAFQHSPVPISPLNETKQLDNAAPAPISPSASRPRLSSHSQRMGNRRLSVNINTPTPKNSSTSDVFDEASPLPGSTSKQKPADSLMSLLAEPAEWEEELLEPLVELQLDYARLERHYLVLESEKESTASETAVGQEAPESSALLGSRLVRVLKEDCRIARGLAEDATLRNISLTYGLASDELVSCLDQLYLAKLDKFRISLEHRSREVVQFARRQASGKLEEVRVMTNLATGSSVEEEQWKAFEESVGLLATMHQVEEGIEAVEKFASERLKEVGDMVLGGGSQTAVEATNRLSGQGSKSPLAVLARHCSDRLQPGSLLIATLESARTMARSASTSAGKRQGLLMAARQSVSKQLKIVQQHLIDMTLAPLMSYTELYTQLSIWEANRLPGSVNEYELAMPTFSLSPTEEMSRIGEGLLDLPRLLEVWSDNADLLWAVRGLPFVATDGAEEQKQEQTSLGGRVEQTEGESGGNSSPMHSNKRMSFHPSSSPTLDRRANSHRHTASLAAIATLSATAPPSTEANTTLDGDNESVLQTYLSSIALSLLSHLTSLVLPSISKLTSAGASQLAADLEYLLNILSALNVNVSPLPASATTANNQSVFLIRSLEAWKDSCKLKDADGRRVASHIRSGQMARGVALTGIEGFQEDEDRLKSLAGTQPFDMVGRMRGW